MKRILAMALSIALIATLAISGTIAYLTDSDDDTNVFTVGNVVIDQREWKRVLDGDTFTGYERIDLSKEDGTSIRHLFPAVEPEIYGKQKKETTSSTESGSTIKMPTNVENYLDKIVDVKNIGRSDAYIRTIIAVPTAGLSGFLDEEGNEQWLHLDLSADITPTENSSYASKAKTEWIDGVTLINGEPYQLLVVTYTDVISGSDNVPDAADASHFTPVSLMGIWMDSAVDYKVTRDANGEVTNSNSGDYYFGDKKLNNIANLNIYVKSQACQSEGFKDKEGEDGLKAAEVALNASFGSITATNNPFISFTPVEPDPSAGTKTYTLNSASDLLWFANQVNNEGNSFAGATVQLGSNINCKNMTMTPIGQYVKDNGDAELGCAANFAGTFDGKNYTISNLNIVADNAYCGENDYTTGFFGHTGRGAVIKNVTFDHVNVTGHHFTGVVAGKGFDAKFSDVTVKNSTVICSHVNDNACGDKAGAILGYMCAGSLTNSSASNCTVKAGRDAGGLVGCITDNATVGANTCSADNVTVSAHNSCTASNKGTNITANFVGRES